MKKNKRKRVLQAILLILLVLVLACSCYLTDYYHAENSVSNSLQSKQTVTVKEISNGYYFDGPGKEQAIIFYPGAKVEFTAYAPLMQQLAEQGVDCFMLKVPCNLAFFGKNEADLILTQYDYEQWYLAGHSLGGAMAAVYAANNQEELTGLILLAAYPTCTLTGKDFKLLSIYGSEDGVLNMEKFENGKQYWPENSVEVCIQGGNHAYYGNYGEQKGDGNASISREEQQSQTVEAIIHFIQNN